MMPHLKGELSCKPLISPFTAAILHHTVVLLLLTTQCCAGESQLVGSAQPIVATVGDDIILLCHLEPAVDASGMTVEWTRPDLNPRFIHVWRDGVELESKKHPSYRGRTSLFVNNLKDGDVSLKLSKVKLSDEGKYRCFIPTLGRESTVEVVVGVMSTIIISLVRTQKNEDISGLVLQCESKGWYPEPEVSWLDSEGHVLSAGPTETVRGPDGLYTVSSRVTVEKRHNNNFTCRVQQKDINQIRETQIRIPEDVFKAPSSSSSSSVCIIVVLSVVGFLLFPAVVFVFRKLRQNKSQKKTQHDNETEGGTEERQRLCKGSIEMKDLDHKQLEEKEKEKKEMIHVIIVLMEKKEELENDRDKLMLQLEEVDRKTRVNEKELESVNGERWRKDSKKKKLSEVRMELDDKKTEHEKSLQSTEGKIQTTVDVITRITEWKKEIDDQIEQMKEQTDEAELQSEQREKEETNKTTDSLTLRETHY